MKIIISVISFIILYAGIGSFFEAYKIIETPAWWALYGSVMAILFSVILDEYIL